MLNDSIKERSDQIIIDQRCCGSGACIINPEGECWCGQKWNGEKMAFPKQEDNKDDSTEFRDF